MEILIEKLAPSIEKITTAVLTRRAGPPRAARPAGVPPSSAEVVETKTPEQPAPETVEPASHRWAAAVDAMARAIARGDEPGDFADTLDAILNDDEFGMLRLADTETLMPQILAIAGDRFEILKTPHAKSFLDAVLKEIQSAESEDGSPPSDQ